MLSQPLSSLKSSSFKRSGAVPSPPPDRCSGRICLSFCRFPLTYSIARIENIKSYLCGYKGPLLLLDEESNEEEEGIAESNIQIRAHQN